MSHVVNYDINCSIVLKSHVMQLRLPEVGLPAPEVSEAPAAHTTHDLLNSLKLRKTCTLPGAMGFAAN